MIIAQIASIPSRYYLFEKKIYSLYNQVDKINVFLNNYEKVPNYFISYPNVTGKLMDNSTGDAAKFHGVENLEGYIFTCDDDLIYPPDYISTMITQIDKYKCIITNHGRILFDRPISSYYRDNIVGYHCLLDVKDDHRVDVGGTGVMGFHSKDFKIKYSDFKLPNMADIWVAVNAWNKTDIVVNSHKEGWIKYQDTPDKTIWELHCNNDLPQTELVNKYLT